MRVALVHDWLIHMRGGEKVLESFAELFPEATIYTLFTNRKLLSASLQRMKVKTSFLQYVPGIRKIYRWLLPILPWVIRTIRIEETDLVISSSHCVAKGVRVPQGAVHVCYCHTPMRYLWGFEGDYFKKFPAWVRDLLKPVFERIREWDVSTAEQVHHFFCNSKTVQERIGRIYGRDAQVIHAPVDAGFYKPDSLPAEEKGRFYLVVSALVPYKRVDVVIEAFNGWDRKLMIAGDGPSRSEYEPLKKTENIQFLGTVTDETLRRLYEGAKALIFPQEEDFGIVPLEAQACGTPVIAFGRGGALESVNEGVFFHEQSAEAVRQAVLEFESKQFDTDALRRQALRFDKPVFKTKIKQAIENVIH
jgi:glycosyltransferase involved in cell wall biosynthesis